VTLQVILAGQAPTIPNDTRMTELLLSHSPSHHPSICLWHRGWCGKFAATVAHWLTGSMRLWPELFVFV